MLNCKRCDLDAPKDRHPWLEIPITDYEAHMALPSVGQAQLLGTALQRTVTQFQPRSLAVLGVAGGNGLELVDPAIVRRVVALDFNPDYVALCTRRHATSFDQFEPVLHDLSQGPPPIAPVECIFAGLVLEYLCIESFCGYLADLLTTDGNFAALLQLPSASLPEISASPFSSLSRLEPAFSFVHPTSLDDALFARGFSRIASERYKIDSGKSFYYASYQITNAT
jgi:hypothetical protein